MTSVWGSSWGSSWGSLVRPEQTGGRSGYWRLFFHQLQEQALQKTPERKLPEPKLEPVVELQDGSAIVGKVQRTKKLRLEPEVNVPEKLPPFKPKLVASTRHDEPSEPYIIQIMRAQMEISRLFTAWQIPAIIYPAQDVEDEELLLLLAA